jgi:hypothetical protein
LVAAGLALLAATVANLAEGRVRRHAELRWATAGPPPPPLTSCNDAV